MKKVIFIWCCKIQNNFIEKEKLHAQFPISSHYWQPSPFISTNSGIWTHATFLTRSLSTPYTTRLLCTANFFMVNFIDFDYVINPTIVPSWFWPILIINLTVSKSFKVINKYHENCKIHLLKIQYFFNRSGIFLP